MPTNPAPPWRQFIELLVECLIDALDQIDTATEDLEDGGDAEPDARALRWRIRRED